MSLITEILSHSFFKNLMIMMSAGLLLQACGGGGGGGGGGSAPPPNSPWTWISGSNIVNQAGVYGTQGTAAATNVPGARERAASWTDSSNNFWLMGGLGYDSAGSLGDLNDLWKYDGVNWTWISGSNIANQTGVYGTKGVAATTNVPGARSNALNWIDSNNNLWLMGGVGPDSVGTPGRFNDLWKFDGTHWTWVSGSDTFNQLGVYGNLRTPAATNVPGARQGAASWIDSSNNLWLMGGFGPDNTGALRRFNDLWKFDGTNWTWISGSNTANQVGIYGTKGVGEVSNVPGARNLAMAWIDSGNILWLMGGFSVDSSGTVGNYNDLWKFDPGTNLWIWVSGSNTSNQPGVYGTRGTAAPANVPGARVSGASWIDSSNTLWLMGGRGYDSTGTTNNNLNDLWKFDGVNWTWVYGSNTVNQSGNYGTQGVVGPDRVPGARAAPAAWIDSSNRLWLFGGSGSDSAGTVVNLNDLWRYTP